MARRRVFGAAAACAGLAAGGTAAWAAAHVRGTPGTRQDPAAAPLALSTVSPDVPRVAWVFSSGGPRGFVHIGVLKGLARLGLAPDLIVGASAGALAGTLWAAGLGAQRLEQLALDLQPWDVLRWNPRGPEWFHGGGLVELVNEALGGRWLEELPVPVACVAVRADNGEAVAFGRSLPGGGPAQACAHLARRAPGRRAAPPRHGLLGGLVAGLPRAADRRRRDGSPRAGPAADRVASRACHLARATVPCGLK